MSKTTLLYSVHWTCRSWSKHFGEIYSVDKTLVHYTSPKYLILTIIRYETQAGKSVKVSHSKLKQLSSKGSIMDRAAKWSKEKTNSLWKFEQKLLMNMQSFTELLGLSTSYFVKLTTTGSLKFVLKWTVLMFNHSSNSKESIHLFELYWKCIWGYFILLI